MEIESKRVYTVVITTNLGRMTFNLNTQEAPLAANSLVFLARQGFYDGMTVHRLLPGVLAETGDPTGSGGGGPGYAFEIEPPHRPYVPGDLVMANAGTPNSNGSRFFIILGDVSANGDLPPDYTLVGQIKGNHKPSFKTLENVGAVAVGPGLHGEMSAPQDQITIASVLATEGCKATGAFTYKCL
jgi:cyclophilin family peptidyl-prolyl cis-trans isomerase